MNARSVVLTCAEIPASLFLLTLLAGTAAAQSNQVVVSGNHGIKIRKVFVNVTGDPKLARRFLSFLDIELEDSKFLLVDTEAEADAEADAQVSPQAETVDLSLGIVQMRLTANGKTETTDSCASLGNGQGVELFDHAAKTVAEQIREKYPKAKTLRLDPLSDMTASNLFGAELPGRLSQSNFNVVEAAPADLDLRLNLALEKVPVDEEVVNYNVTVTLRDGSRPFSSDGRGILSAKAISAPRVCPGQVEDLDWLTGDDQLFQTARYLAKSLRKHNLAAAAGEAIKR